MKKSGVIKKEERRKKKKDVHTHAHRFPHYNQFLIYFNMVRARTPLLLLPPSSPSFFSLPPSIPCNKHYTNTITTTISILQLTQYI